jgi:hypothetical protein
MPKILFPQLFFEYLTKRMKNSTNQRKEKGSKCTVSAFSDMAVNFLPQIAQINTDSPQNSC